MSEIEFDYSDLVMHNRVSLEEIDPKVEGGETLEDELVSRYNPFTKSFEMVPQSWRLKRNIATEEWHFRPD